MKGYTLLDYRNTSSLKTVIEDMSENSEGSIKELSRMESVVCIFGAVAWMANDDNGLTIKVVEVDLADGAWDRKGKGIYIHIPIDQKGLSMNVSDLYVGDEITATICPSFSCCADTCELTCFCYDIREGSGKGEADGKIISEDEAIVKERKEANEREQAKKKKERLPKSIANLSLIIALSGYAFEGTLMPSLCGGLGIALGVVSYFMNKNWRAVFGLSLGIILFIM